LLDLRESIRYCFSYSYINHIQMKKITRNPDNSSEPLIGGPALAEHYDVHDGTIRRWKREGMPCHAFNSKMVRYKLSEVEAWLSQRLANRPMPASDYSGLRNQPAMAK
jgi:hypothetical protein